MLYTFCYALSFYLDFGIKLLLEMEEFYLNYCYEQVPKSKNFVRMELKTIVVKLGFPKKRLVKRLGTAIVYTFEKSFSPILTKRWAIVLF